MKVLSLKGEIELIKTRGIKAGFVVKLPNGDNAKITKIYRDHLGSAHYFDVYISDRNQTKTQIKMQYLGL